MTDQTTPPVCGTPTATIPVSVVTTHSPPPGLAAGGGGGGSSTWSPKPPVVALGATAATAAADALAGHLGLTVTGDIDSAEAGKANYFWWAGEVPGAAGAFWIPALYLSRHLPAVYTDVQAARASKGTPVTVDEARELTRRYHSGLGRRRVAHAIAAYVEIDHLKTADQMSRYVDLATWTGLTWTLMVSSGGKSIHAYLAFSRHLDLSDSDDEKLRHEIQRLLIVCLEGDTTIAQPACLLRLPGYDGHDRRQPIVHLDSTAIHDPVVVRDRLRTYATSLGIGDVDLAVSCLATAKRLDDEAGHQGGDAAEELRDMATRLRATRGAPADANLLTAAAMLGSPASSASATTTTSGPSTSGPKGRILRVPDADMAPYVGLAHGTRTEAPCCAAAGHSRLGGVVLSQPGDPSPRLYCHRCGHAVVVGVLDDHAAVEAAVLAALDAAAISGVPDAPGRRLTAREVRILAYMDTYRHRLSSRWQKAQEIPVEVVAAAEAAIKAASNWHTEIRRAWRTAGLDRRGHLCGSVNQGLGDVSSGKAMVIGRRCDRLSCIFCGPLSAARKAAAVLRMPIVDKGGLVIGAPLGERPVWYAEVDRAKFATWLRQWRRKRSTEGRVRLPPNNPLYIIRRKSDTLEHGAHGYVALEGPDDQTITVLSTLSTPGAIRLDALDDADALAIVGMAYSVRLDDACLLADVHGRMTSSQGLRLDPDSVARLASSSTWVVERTHTVSPAEAERKLRESQVEHQEHRDEDGVLSAVTTEALDPAERSQFWDAMQEGSVATVPKMEPDWWTAAMSGCHTWAAPEPADLEHEANDAKVLHWTQVQVEQAAADCGYTVGVGSGVDEEMQKALLARLLEAYAPTEMKVGDVPANSISLTAGQPRY